MRLPIWALKWAARLHEIGLDVSHSGYHRNGAYLLENADMRDFRVKSSVCSPGGRCSPP